MSTRTSGLRCWEPSAGCHSPCSFRSVPSGFWAAMFLVPVLFFMSMPFGVAPAAIQQMMPNTMRAQATAIYLFVINLIGMGSVPRRGHVDRGCIPRQERRPLFAAGRRRDRGVSAAILLWLGLKPYRRSLDYLKEWSSADV